MVKMAYGYRSTKTRTYKPRTYGGTRARRGYTKQVQITKRAQTVAAKRKLPTTTRKLAVTNARKLVNLQNQIWGPKQETISMWDGLHVPILNSHPLIFHVNNFNSGNHGPHINRVVGAQLHNAGTFAKANIALDYEYHDHDHIPNGPKIQMCWAMFEFEFKGFCDNTHVRIDFVRQKKMVTDLWNQNNNNIFLPASGSAFRGLAGFGVHHIDRKTFQVLGTKKLFFNSKGSSNAVDTVQDRNTLDATTRNIQHCKMYLPLGNRTLKQLNSSIDETNMVDETDQDVSTSTPVTSNYSYDNLHPLSNIFCVISCDDLTAMDAAVTGDAISCRIIRRVCWRDPRE